MTTISKLSWRSFGSKSSSYIIQLLSASHVQSSEKFNGESKSGFVRSEIGVCKKYQFQMRKLLGFIKRTSYIIQL